MPSIPTTGMDFFASESACSAPRPMSSFSATMPSMRSPKPDNQFFVLFTASSRFQFAVSLREHLDARVLRQHRFDALGAVQFR